MSQGRNFSRVILAGQEKDFKQREIHSIHESRNLNLQSRQHINYCSHFFSRLLDCEVISVLRSYVLCTHLSTKMFSFQAIKTICSYPHSHASTSSKNILPCEIHSIKLSAVVFTTQFYLPIKKETHYPHQNALVIPEILRCRS